MQPADLAGKAATGGLAPWPTTFAISSSSSRPPAEFLNVAARLAVRLRVADPDSARKAATEIKARRAALAKSPMLEAGVTADILGAVVKALIGEE